MELAVDSFSFGIYGFEGVTTIAIHVPVAVRNATVTEQEGNLVGGLRTETNEVPEHIRILRRIENNKKYFEFEHLKSILCRGKSLK